LNDKKSILAIGAHPDDVELGCGGALAKHAEQGDHIFILTLSRGSQGGDADTRTQESVSAAEMIGATLKMGDFIDGRIIDDTATIMAIHDVVSHFKPTHVYTHAFEDTHQDHRNIYLSTLVAAREVPNIFCYQAPSSTVDFRPNLFVDISNHMQMKIDLIAAHESQLNGKKSLEPDLIRATARYWGRFAGCILAEPMVIFRQCA